ncbi:MAG: hypothetical protein AB7V43_19825 [Acidimicrobiia bacterium]
MNIARQPYYRWPTEPVSDPLLNQALVANGLFDAHRDDPEFGSRSSPTRPARPATALDR